MLGSRYSERFTGNKSIDPAANLDNPQIPPQTKETHATHSLVTNIILTQRQRVSVKQVHPNHFNPMKNCVWLSSWESGHHRVRQIDKHHFTTCIPGYLLSSPVVCKHTHTDRQVLELQLLGQHWDLLSLSLVPHSPFIPHMKYLKFSGKLFEKTWGWRTQVGREKLARGWWWWVGGSGVKLEGWGAGGERVERGWRGSSWSPKIEAGGCQDTWDVEPKHGGTRLISITATSSSSLCQVIRCALARWTESCIMTSLSFAFLN